MLSFVYPYVCNRLIQLSRYVQLRKENSGITKAQHHSHGVTALLSRLSSLGEWHDT